METETIPTEEKPTEEIPASDPPEKSEPEPATVPASDQPLPAGDAFAEIGAALVDGKPEENAHYSEIVKNRVETEAAASDLEQNGGDWRLLKDRNGHYWEVEKCSSKVDPKTNLPEKSKKGMWILKKGIKRNSLSKKRPKISEAVAGSVDQVELDAQTQQNEIIERSAMYTAGFMKVYCAAMSKVSGEAAVSDVMAMSIGEGKYKVQVGALMAGTVNNLLVKYGGGPELSPELVAALGLPTVSGMIIFHKTQEKRRLSFKEKVGLWWYRIRNKKKPQKKVEQSTGYSDPEQKTAAGQGA